MDRSAERQVLDQLVEAVRLGASQALVVRGEPGVGKTALLEYTAGRARGCRLVRAAGVEAEMELAFAGLHQLCAPMLNRDTALPEPQRAALHTAFGLHSGPAPDRFLVGLAVLGLLAEVAREQPLVCVIDDAQWLDRASVQALAFVARRLVAESVALVFAARGSEDLGLGDLAQLTVAGLPEKYARALLESVLHGPHDERVLERVVAETRGNPLALLELPRGLTIAELAGGFAPAGPSTVTKRIEVSYRWQLAPLPTATRQLLLVAAAEPVGDPVLLWRAAERLGTGVAAAAPAVEAGLLEIGAGVRFRHPLLRSAVYEAASADERRTVHRALADATDPEVDPDRRAWHAAQAAAGPDEQVATELEDSAGRAGARGGLAAAAAFLRRAAELTPDPAGRTRRALAAARATHLAGSPDAALHLLSVAEAGKMGTLQRARVDLLRAQIAFAMNRPGDATPLLLGAASQLEPLDPGLARQTYRDAYIAAMYAGRFAGTTYLPAVARAVRAAPAQRPHGAADLLLDGMALLILDGYPAGAPLVGQALAAFPDQAVPAQEMLHWLYLACRAAFAIGDLERFRTLSTHSVRIARDEGALSVLPIALAICAASRVFAGDLADAASMTAEWREITEAMGIARSPTAALVLAAWQGQEAEVFRLVAAATGAAESRREGQWMDVVIYSRAVLYNGLSRYEDALEAARQGIAYMPELGPSLWVLPELIEAATRCGRTEAAVDALARLAATTRASGTAWALGIHARSQAQLSVGEAAENGYRVAIERLGVAGLRGELARAHLLYGEWLRRERRRLDAREELRTAHDMFVSAGMDAFAQRAARELLATGETARRRRAETGGELTVQEAQIARLVRERLSNPEIAARLFISPRTVEWHLSRIFAKLQLTSRRQLFRYGDPLGPLPRDHPSAPGPA